MEDKKINDIIHELTKCGQSFHSYEQLLDNPNFSIDNKKLREVLKKCAKNCLNLRNLMLGGIKDEANT